MLYYNIHFGLSIGASMKDTPLPRVYVYLAVISGHYSVGIFSDLSRSSDWLYHFITRFSGYFPPNFIVASSILVLDNVETLDYEEHGVPNTVFLKRVTPFEAFRVIMNDYRAGSSAPSVDEDMIIPSDLLDLPLWYIEGWRGFDLTQDNVSHTVKVWASVFS